MSFIPQNFRPWYSGGRKLKSALGIMEISFGHPNYNDEWKEARAYQEFKIAGKPKWLNLVKKGKMVKYDKSGALKIANTEAGTPVKFNSLVKSKRENFHRVINSGQVELPIIAKYSDGFKICIAGNTIFTGQMFMFKEAWVLEYYVPDEISDLADLPKSFWRRK